MKALLFKIALRLLALLPLKVLQGLGAVLGRLTYLASGQYAARLRENLGYACNTEFQAMLPAAIAEAGKSIMELVWLWGTPYDEVLSRIVEVSGQEHVAAAQACGKGIIFLTPHLGCFEMCSLYLAKRMPITLLYRQPKLHFMEDAMKAGRARGQAKLAKADVSGVRLLFKALKHKEAIGLLPDQAPSQGEGEWADFFNHPAYTMTLLGRLAQRSDASTLLIHCERLPKAQGYVIRIEPLLLDFSAPVPRQVNAALERTIRNCPAQYLWGYNRYKTPNGAKERE
jgi:Kdo2-lipid IVA lauroyltransferase/acyltransferase